MSGPANPDVDRLPPPPPPEWAVLRRRVDAVLLTLLGAAAVVFPFTVRTPYALTFGILVLFFAYYALCWNIIGGFARQLSVCHPVYLAIGAYTSTTLFVHYGLTPWLGMLVGAALAVAVSLAIGQPSFRLRGPYFALATLGFLQIGRLFMQDTEYLGPIRLGQAAGITIPSMGQAPLYYQFTSRIPFYFIILAGVVGLLVFSRWLRDSRLGYYLNAIRDDQEAAQSLGIDATRMKLVALGLSAALTAMAGTFYAQLFGFIDPIGTMSLDMAFQPVLLVIVGGQGTVAGPLIGALFLRPLTDLSNSLLGGTPLVGIHLIVLGAILIAVVIWLPKGLHGPLTAAYGAVFRRFASIVHPRPAADPPTHPSTDPSPPDRRSHPTAPSRKAEP